MKRTVDQMRQALAVSLLGIGVAGLSLAYAAGVESASLARAHRASVNGKMAVAGMTLFNQARLKTEKDGVMLAQIGPTGSVNLGAESEVNLRLTSDGIGGELMAGNMRVSARSGVPILITVAGTTITTDGKQPGSLMVMVQGQEIRLVSLLSDVQVSHDGQTEVVKKGQVVGFDRRKSRRRVVPLGLITTFGGVGAAATFSSILNSSTGRAVNVLPQVSPGVNPSPTTP